LADTPWLDGPMGEPAGIGSEFFERYAAQRNLEIRRVDPCGLVESLAVLRHVSFDPTSVPSPVAAFYRETSAYELNVWSEWSTAFRPFGRALAWIFSRRLGQLNVPLSSLDTSRGMSSDVREVVDPATDRRLFTAWTRRLNQTGDVIYAGAYSTCVVPDEATPCVRVVFPLPNGNAIVVMRPTMEAGALVLRSAGRGFGGPGFYFTVRDRHASIHARYVRTFRETIRVYASEDGVRADHAVSIWRLTFLRLHYRLRRRPAAEPAA
jgi:hypothetical protein